jgi:hypothetical protein
MRLRIELIAIVSCFAFASPAVAEPSAGQRDAATELLRAMGLERTMLAGATTMVDMQIQQNPTLGPFRGVLLKWAERFMTWEAVSPQLIDLYADRFTESELKELVAFYRTPTGQKALVEMPSLMQKGAGIGVELAKKHAPELEQMIRERAQELKKATQKPDSVGSGSGGR